MAPGVPGIWRIEGSSSPRRTDRRTIRPHLRAVDAEETLRSFGYGVEGDGESVRLRHINLDQIFAIVQVERVQTLRRYLDVAPV